MEHSREMVFRSSLVSANETAYHIYPQNAMKIQRISENSVYADIQQYMAILFLFLVEDFFS